MRQWWDNWIGFPAAQAGWFWGAEKQAAIGALSQYEDYKGLVDEIRFWSRAKSPEEITHGWTHGVAGGENGLVGLYRFSECSGTTIANVLDPQDTMQFFGMKPGFWSQNDAPVVEATAVPVAMQGSERLPGGGVRLILTGVSGQPLRLERGTDLTTWTTILNQPMIGSVLVYDDTAAVGMPRAFYRGMQ